MTGYDLSRKLFDWSFENPDKITPTHIALYFAIVETCNRLGWKEKFGLPTTVTMEMIGVKSYKTYIKVLNDLIEFGFIKLITKSKNQFTSNVVALVNFTEAHTKASTEATTKALTNSMLVYSNNKPLTNKPKTREDFDLSFVDVYFLPIVKDFILYRKEIKDPFKTLRGVKSFYDKLLKLSGNNLSKAQELTTTAKDNEWKTVYPPKIENKPAFANHDNTKKYEKF